VDDITLSKTSFGGFEKQWSRSNFMPNHGALLRGGFSTSTFVFIDKKEKIGLKAWSLRRHEGS